MNITVYEDVQLPAYYILEPTLHNLYKTILIFSLFISILHGEIAKDNKIIQ